MALAFSLSSVGAIIQSVESDRRRNVATLYRWVCWHAHAHAHSPTPHTTCTCRQPTAMATATETRTRNGAHYAKLFKSRAEKCFLNAKLLLNGSWQSRRLALATGRRSADRGVAATSQFHFVIPPPPHTRIVSVVSLFASVCAPPTPPPPRPLLLIRRGTFFALRLKSGNAYPNTWASRAAADATTTPGKRLASVTNL